MNYAIYFIVTFSVFMLSTVMIVLSGPFFWFGVKHKLSKMFKGSNAALSFKKNKADNFGLPNIIDLKETMEKDGDKRFFTEDGSFAGPRFFGMPAVMYTDDDTLTSLGLHYKDKDKGITEVKPSKRLSPDVVKAIIDGKAITQAVQELFAKHKTQIYILAGIALGIGVAAYFTYQMHSVSLPAMQTEIESMKSMLEIMKNNATLVGVR